MLSTIRDSFLNFHFNLFFLSFVLLRYWLEMVRVDILALFLILGAKHSILKDNINCRFFIDVFYQFEENSFYSPLAESFLVFLIMKDEICQMFFCLVFLLCSLNVGITWIDFQMLNQYCIPGVISSLSWCKILFICSLDAVILSIRDTGW